MQPLTIPNELRSIYAQPGTLSGAVAQRARTLYSGKHGHLKPISSIDPIQNCIQRCEESSIHFHPSMLSEFGMAIFTGDLETVKKIYGRDHPNLTATETCFEWGYISLAVFGSQRITKSPPGMVAAHAKVIIYLLLNGAPIDIPDIAGSTALHHLTTKNLSTDVLKAVFSGRPDPNARDRYGSTPLQYAVMASQVEVIDRCLANGGDLGVADGDGITPSSLLIHATPAVAAIVGKHKREKLGTSEPVEDRGKCVVCGKTGRVSKCARCRLTRYCGPECQRIHWKNGHNVACVPFDSEDATVTLKISRPPNFTIIPTAAIRSGIPDGEDMWRSEGSSSKGKKAGKKAKELDPSNVIGKTVIVKVQLPMGGLNGMMVYNRTKELSCQISPDGQAMEYARLEKRIREGGWMGVKGYFMAEVGNDTLKIKVKEILANQPW